jgi:Right handed beta helix region
MSRIAAHKRLLALSAVAALSVGIWFLMSGGGGGRPAIADGRTPHNTGPSVYVDAGSIGGPCSDSRTIAQAVSASTPLCSIPAGINLVSSGGTVLVRGGSYPALTVSGSGRTSYVTVAANGSEAVSVPSINVTSGAGFFRFSGLQLTGSSSASTLELQNDSHDVQLIASNVASQMQEAIKVDPGVSNVLIAGNHISSRVPGATSGGDAITFASTSTLPGSPPNEPNEAPISNVTILNNRIDNVGTDAIRPTNFINLSILGNDITGVDENGSHTDVIQTVFGGSNLDIEGNYIHDNQGEGILIKDGQVTNARVVNNLFVRNTTEYQFQATGTTGLVLANNTFWDNELSIVLRPGVTNGVVENNLFDNLSAYPAGGVSGIHEDYNLVAGGYGWTYGPHDVHASARFVNSSAEDYRLAAGSPGIDGADASVAPPYDKACRARYDVPNVANRGTGSVSYGDIGALEFSPLSQPGDTAAPWAQCGTGAGGTPSSTGAGNTSQTSAAAKANLACAWVGVRHAGRSQHSLWVYVHSARRAVLVVSAVFVRVVQHHKRMLGMGRRRVKMRAGHTFGVQLKLDNGQRAAMQRVRRPLVSVRIRAQSHRGRCTRTVLLRAA